MDLASRPQAPPRFHPPVVEEKLGVSYVLSNSRLKRKISNCNASVYDTHILEEFYQAIVLVNTHKLNFRIFTQFSYSFSEPQNTIVDLGSRSQALPDFIPQLRRKIESYLISHLLKSPVTRPGSGNTRVQSNATIECPHASTADGIIH